MTPDASPARMSRTMKQPRKAVLRLELSAAKAENAELRAKVAKLSGEKARLWKWLTALNVGAMVVIAVGQWLT